MELNLKQIKDVNNIPKGGLYKVEKNQTIKIIEQQDDLNDVVELEFMVNDNQYGIFGYEFKPEFVKKHGCKTADILCFFVDDNLKEVHTYIFDMKRNIIAFDVMWESEKLRKIPVREIIDYISQIEASVRHKNCLLQYMSEYCETQKLGIATRYFDQEKLRKLAEKLLESTKISSGITNPLIENKLKLTKLPIEIEATIVQLFAEKKMKILGEIHDFEVYILEKNIQENIFEYKLVVI